MRSNSARFTCLTASAILCVSTLLATGCVERKITISTAPAGALVYLNDVEIGRAPVTVPFLWYGEYDVRIRLERQEGTPENPQTAYYYLRTSKRTDMPVHQWPGLDLLADAAPFTITDHQQWTFDVPRVVHPSDDVLLKNATELKDVMEKPANLQDPATSRPSTQPATQPTTSTAPATRPAVIKTTGTPAS